jgi:MFS family permease
MSLSTPLPPVGQLRANFYHLYADIAWYGILAGSSMAFLAVYAARAGANTFQVGLLTAAPGLVNLLFSLPAGRWLEGRQVVRIAYSFSIWHRLGYLALVPLPWLLPANFQVWGLVLIALYMSLPGTVLAIAFNAMFADVVPPEWRALVVGRRNALLAISMTLTALASGQVLDRVVFPLNYQIVFLLGGIGALMSSYHLGRLQPPQGIPARVWKPLGEQASPGILRALGAIRHSGLRYLARTGGQKILRLDLIKGPFGRFLSAYLVFYTFQYLALPVFPLFYVNELGLSDGAISLGSALFHALVMIVSLRLGRLAAAFGYHGVAVRGALILGAYPLLLFLAQDATLFWVASLFGGVSIGMLNGGLVNRLMERVPEEDRPAHMALHNLALNLGILAGSLSGPLLAEWIGLRPMMLASSGLRFFAGLFLLLWG